MRAVFKCAGAILLGLLAAADGAWAAGISERNVLVLYNADDDQGPLPDDWGPGHRIADHYQSDDVHPGAHIVGLTGINAIYGGGDTMPISAADYLSVIRPQVLAAIAGIADSIDVIVTTKGLPLKINAGAGSGAWSQFSSLESELTRIDSIDTVEKVGNQYYLWTGPNGYKYGLACNPYYATNVPFVRNSSSAYNNIRLTSRLDGYSVDSVTAAIDKARKAFVVPLPYGPMVVVDDDPSAAGEDQMTSAGNGPGPGLQAVLDAWQLTAGQSAAESLGQPGYQFPTPFGQFDGTDEATTSAPGKVIGYVSHGLHDNTGGLEPGYIQSQFQFQLANGAVFQSHESSNAASFDASYSQDQGLVAQWLEIGGTTGLGHVKEPGSGPANVANEDLLYQLLLPAAGAGPGTTGLTFVEAAWNATRQLSYVNTVVGDPLMRFQMWLPGDLDLDGCVNVNDLTLLQANWMQQGTFGQGDSNGDGVVNVEDLEIMQANWLKHVQGGTVVSAGSNFPRAPIVDPATGYPVVPIPEPTSWLLMVLGSAALGLGSRSVSRRGEPNGH